LRDHIAIRMVEQKCEILKRGGLWPSPPAMRPVAWLNNFDSPDKVIAASLLDRFTYCNSLTVNAMLRSAWQSVADGFPKGPNVPNRELLLGGLERSWITPVEGETPRPTDSGYLFCRKARQILRMTDEMMIDTRTGIEKARQGDTIIFVDDFVGSGDQFLETWTRAYNRRGESFATIHREIGYNAIYITLVTTDYGLAEINRRAPNVAVCPAHVLTEKSTVCGLANAGLIDRDSTEHFLEKYSKKLTPKEDYMAGQPSYLKYGYKNRGLLIGFEHSIPDATLPIFWSPGIEGWEPLIERL